MLIIILLLIFSSILAEDNSIYILHTNNTNGALENCYCPDHPFGAIEKRSVFINNFIREHPNTIVVDAGDFFSVTHRPFLDSLIIDAYTSLPYDAILVGDQELSRNNLNQHAKKLNKPLLAANLLNHIDLGIKSHIIINRGNYKIGIVGIINPKVFRFYPQEIKDSIKLENPEESISAFINEFSDSLDLIIALTHQGHDNDVSLAESITGLDIIVGSHTQTKLDSGDVVNGSLVVQAGKEGYYIGIVEVQFDKEKNIKTKSARIETMTLGMPDDPYIMKLINAYEIETGHINRNKLKHQKSK
jgi:5'-nucleotidase/UDP-sugar diphosphatase